jgi:hypothetical protein
MSTSDKTRPRRPKRRRRDPDADSQPESSGGAAFWFVVGMIVVAVVCLIVGLARHKVDGPTLLAAVGCMVTGIGFVAIGLLELEWLEQLIGFVDGVFSGLTQWCATSWYGTLSDSESVGRRGATVIWVVIGFPVFVWGCLMGLRVVEV